MSKPKSRRDAADAAFELAWMLGYSAREHELMGTSARSLKRQAKAKCRELLAPPGYVLVPVEPTLVMLKKAQLSTCVEPTPTESQRIWAAMLAAAKT